VNKPAALTPGAVGSAELIVGPEHTAPHVGSGKVPVLATPIVINLLEAAALAAVEHLLPEGHQSGERAISSSIADAIATPTAPSITSEVSVMPAADDRGQSAMTLRLVPARMRQSLRPTRPPPCRAPPARPFG